MKLSEYEFDRLEMFLTAEHGWDGGEGKATTRKHVRSALRVLQLIKGAGIPGPSLCMGSDGGIALIYQSSGAETYITLEILDSLYYGAMVFEGDGIQYGWFPLDVLPQFVLDGIQKVRSQNVVQDEA